MTVYIVQHGTTWIPFVQDRNPGDGFRLRGRLHADHDADGPVCPGHLGRRRVCPLPPLGRPSPPAEQRPAASPGLALQPGEDHHRSQDGNERDHVLRERLRRELPPGQEVLLTPDRIRHCPSGRMAGRAHAGNPHNPALVMDGRI